MKPRVMEMQEKRLMNSDDDAVDGMMPLIVVLTMKLIGTFAVNVDWVVVAIKLL